MNRYKQIFVLVVMMFSFGSLTWAQRWGYVDTKAILEKIPEYKAAEQEVEQISQKWQKELEAMYANIEKMYQKYEAEKVLLTADVQRKREEEIINEEKKAKEFQKKKFGYEGELFKLREEKVKPIQDRLFKAIEDISKEKRIDFMLDKSGAVTVLYFNPEYDMTQAVLKKMGIN
jgi:outer membrane protein